MPLANSERMAGSLVFSAKSLDALILVALEDTQAGRFLAQHRLDGNRDIRLVLPVEIRHRGIIHAVQVVSSQDEHVFCAG